MFASNINGGENALVHTHKHPHTPTHTHTRSHTHLLSNPHTNTPGAIHAFPPTAVVYTIEHSL